MEKIRIRIRDGENSDPEWKKFGSDIATLQSVHQYFELGIRTHRICHFPAVLQIRICMF
jgi:hypothetical protein